MISDLHAMPDGMDLSADVCIVGSGPAGLTLAREFAGTRYRVILLEAGGITPERETQELYAGQIAGLNYPLTASRLRLFGGTMNHWTGQCGMLPPRHMRDRSWVARSPWPIEPDELAPYYVKASRLLEVGAVERDVDVAGPADTVTLSPDGPLVPCVWWRRFGGPIHLGERMRRELEEAANIHVVLHANVRRLTTDGSAREVTSVEFSTLDGRVGRARARYVVLACGGLEVPRLLLNTDEVEPAGLGNSRGLVGRHFMDHLNAVIGTLFLEDTEAAQALRVLATYRRDNAGLEGGSWRPALCLGDGFEREQKVNGGYYRLFFREQAWSREWSERNEDTSFLHYLRTTARLFDERLYGALRQAFGHPMSATEAGVYAEFEQMPNPESRVRLTRDRDRLGMRKVILDWRISEQDIRTARAMGEALGREASLSDWGRFQFADWILEQGAERSAEFSMSSHHIGTTRMAHDPQFGVVDPECRLFACENLYVAGSAVFPTASFVNPTLTIVALAYRLADTLKTRLR
jgi:choline dehydrogenase-like flavoprotein